MLTIKEIKSEMLNFTDYYGGDIPDTDAIKKAKTKKELRKIMSAHIHLMEDTLNDAITHIEDFMKRVGIYD